MSERRVLVTGGAGFIGASLALELAVRQPDWEIIAFDNLHRRGSELNLPRLREAGVRFGHGDLREPGDLAENFGLATVIDRCGVIAGPWQMGSAAQGVFAHWMLAFYFRRPLSYVGFGGSGKQVRDLLHVADLAELVEDQLRRPAHWAGAVVNVDGGSTRNLSLHEASTLCREITGNNPALGRERQARAGDVRIYLSDCRLLGAYCAWRPKRSAAEILGDIYAWIHDHERLVAGALAGA